MPPRAHQLHQPSRFADRELGAHGRARERSSVVRGSRPTGRLDPDDTHPPAARPARRRHRCRPRGPLGCHPRPRPSSRARPPPPPRPPPTGSPPSSRPRTACSRSASGVRTSSPTRASPSMRSSPCWRPARGDDPAVDLALDALAANLTDYITGFETPADRAANAVAKTLLLEEVSGRGRERRHRSRCRPPRAHGDRRGRPRALHRHRLPGLRAVRQRHRPGAGHPRPRSHRRWRSVRSGRLPARPAVLRRQLPALPVRLRPGVRPASGDGHDALVRGPGGGGRGRDRVRAAGTPRGAVVHRGVGRRVRRRRLPARSAAGFRRVLRHRRREQQHDGPGRRRPPRGRGGRCC